jgi:DNA-binding protein HU-beta
MVKADIVDQVQSKTGFSRQKVQESVDLVFESVKEALKRDEKVEFRGFGIFRVKERKKGVGRNLKTGETVPIKSGKTIKFKPSSRFFS